MKSYNSTTFQSRCRFAASYVERYNANPKSFWIAIGKTSPWLDENNPPLPSITVNRLPELYGFYYVHTCLSVVADDSGLIVTPSQNYKPVTSTNYNILSSAKANKVYFEALIEPESMSNDFDYRVRGLCTDVQFNGSPPTEVGPGLFVPSSQVGSYFLDWVSSHTPVENDGVTKQVLQIIREF